MIPKLTHCPGTLAPGFDTYSRTSLKRVFDGRKVSHILPYEAPNSDAPTDKLFEENQKRISISGVQEKVFSIAGKEQATPDQKRRARHVYSKTSS